MMEGKARVGVEIGVRGEDDRERSLTEGSTLFTGIHTQMSRRNTKRAKPNGPRIEVKNSPNKKAEPQVNGWIWERNVMLGQTEDEWAKERESVQCSVSSPSGLIILSYPEERVKFFRDEAEMERWREQVEIKHAELARIIRAFQKSNEIWTALASSNASSPTPGHHAYARKVAMRFALMERDARDRFEACGIPMLRDVDKGETLAVRIMAWRASEDIRFPHVE